ncbi:MAG: glycerol-3-phosphate 1-O-acyltransferase PlsY [Clostridia bacterium]|nr:glycerol-3-phosphate 1-O-acyltransferase PlsY [Clostridia bacterium]
MLRVIIYAVITAIISYLLGSLNFSIIFTKIFTKKDIRTLGSGNAGLTNVIRSTGPVPAILALVGDFGKAVVSAIVANLIFSASDYPGLSTFLALWTGMFCIIGHMFPIFYNFKGGKGVLTAAAMVLMIAPSRPIVFLVCIAIFALLTALTKLVSLSSIIAVSSFPVAFWFFYNTIVPEMSEKVTAFFNQFFMEPRYFLTIFAMFLPFLIIIKHYANIERLLSSNEKNFSFSKKKQSTPPVSLNEDGFKSNVVMAIRLIAVYIVAACLVQQLNPLKFHPNLRVALVDMPNKLYVLRSLFDSLAGGKFVSTWMYYISIAATIVVILAIAFFIIGVLMTFFKGELTEKGIKVCRFSCIYIITACALIILGVIIFNISLNGLTMLPFRLRIPFSSVLTLFCAIMINKLLTSITPTDKEKEITEQKEV